MGQSDQTGAYHTAIAPWLAGSAIHLDITFALLGQGVAAASATASADDRIGAIPKAWLQEMLTVAEAEMAHPGTKDDRAARFPDAVKPSGFQNRAWEELKPLMRPGDKVWTFASLPDSREHLAGRAGIALVRDGVPIRTIVTLMNCTAGQLRLQARD